MENKDSFLGLAHVGLYTDDYEKTMKYYTEVLPFTVVKELYEVRPNDVSGFSPFKYGLVKLNDLYIEIMECADKRNWNNQIGPFHHVGISVRNIDKAIAYLIQRGIPADHIPAPRLNTTLYPGKAFRACSFTGICGERIGLYEFENKKLFESD